MNKTSSISGVIALMFAHCAGMIDMVALPIWVGTLVQYYQFDTQQAGGMVSLFLFGAVLASIVLAHKLHSCNGRWVAVLGFTGGIVCFGLTSIVSDYNLMAILHAAAGVSVGAALTVTHGTIARSHNPHRLFAIVGTALGIFSVFFLGGTSKLVAETGGASLFVVFTCVMLVAAVLALFAFPIADSRLDIDEVRPDKATSRSQSVSKIPAEVWFGVVGISIMGLVQAMSFSFLERVGNSNNYGFEAITGVLIALSIVNLFPAPLAAILEKRWSARLVMLFGPMIQALLAFLIMTSGNFVVYAISACLFTSVIIFTHIFVFGVLSRLDLSGRALAATPAMVMVGAGIGPVLGGTLVKSFGYESLGFVALCLAAISTYSFYRVHRNSMVGIREEQLS